MQQPVSGMHIDHGLMYSHNQDFDCGRDANRKSHAMTSSVIFEKRYFLLDKDRKLKSFTNILKLGDVVSKLVQLKHITNGAPAAGGYGSQ